MADEEPSSRKPCYLLELPKELRLMIYEYLVKPRAIEFISYEYTDHDTPIVADVDESTIAASRFYAFITGPRDDPKASLALQLLRVCRTVYQEAKPLLLQPDTLHLKPASGCTDANPLPTRNTCDLGILTSITTVGVLRVRLATIPKTAANDIRHSTVLAEYLNPDIHYKKFMLQLDDYCLPDGVKDEEQVEKGNEEGDYEQEEDNDEDDDDDEPEQDFGYDGRGPEDLTSFDDVKQLLAIWSKLTTSPSGFFKLSHEGRLAGYNSRLWGAETYNNKKKKKTKTKTLAKSKSYPVKRANEILQLVKNFYGQKSDPA